MIAADNSHAVNPAQEHTSNALDQRKKVLAQVTIDTSNHDGSGQTTDGDGTLARPAAPSARFPRLLPPSTSSMSLSYTEWPAWIELEKNFLSFYILSWGKNKNKKLWLIFECSHLHLFRQTLVKAKIQFSTRFYIDSSRQRRYSSHLTANHLHNVFYCSSFEAWLVNTAIVPCCVDDIIYVNRLSFRFIYFPRSAVVVVLKTLIKYWAWNQNPGRSK